MRRIDAKNLIERSVGNLLIIGLGESLRGPSAVGIDLLRVESDRQLDRGLKEGRPAIADDGCEQDNEKSKPDNDRGKSIELEPDFCPPAAAHERGIVEAAGNRGSGEIGLGWLIGKDAHSYCSRYFRTM